MRIRTMFFVAALGAAAACGDDAPPNLGHLPDANTGKPDASPDAQAELRTVASPSGGTFRAFRDVTLTSSRAATIYYTVDGSEPTTASPSGPSPLVVQVPAQGGTIKYFAQAAGAAAEAVHTEVYALDRLGPPAVSKVLAEVNGTSINLTWENPTDANWQDIVVVRTVDVAKTVAADGQAHVVGDAIGTTGEVVYVGTATSFSEVRPQGAHSYIVYARYRNGVYAEARPAAGYVDSADPVGELVFDAAAQTVTFPKQPAGWTFSATNVAFQEGTLSFDLVATTTAAGVTYMPSIEGRFTTEGPSVPGAFEHDSKEVVPLAGAYTSGQSASVPMNIRVGNVMNGTFAFALHRQALAGFHSHNENGRGGVTDPRTGAFRVLTPSALRQGGSGSAPYTRLQFSPDGQWIYGASRVGASVTKIDPVTGMVVARYEPTIANSYASARMALDPSGQRLYVAITDGAHAGNADFSSTSNAVRFVELRASDLQEVGTPVTLVENGDARMIARSIGMSADGRQVVVPIGARSRNAQPLAHIDLSSMRPSDADAATEGVQHHTLADGEGALSVSLCEFAPSGNAILCALRSGRLLHRVALTDWSVTTHDVALGDRVTSLYPLSDTDVLCAMRNSVVRMNLTTNVATQIVNNGGFAVGLVGQTALTSGNGAAVPDVTGATTTDLTPGPTARGHQLFATPY